ncbi:LuxR C-terminal-related transcriptional regulator [Bradyrhizobium sp. MOS003]|uniref:LuxR C-terminal-related transcriptional regulator n=1 Tax=Bradyrhizobium sp. MOS003 TaxID=2133946 RepID=UPI000D11ED0E|nr:LuxR C-terminal-related transcriptional regulator [Bradyrhizobium sp. MOS003]PSO16094.1 DNA-binding response regulator [Bradyrhizobium sp. MOS003]
MLDATARPGILKPIRLVIVDRQPIVLQGLKSILGTQQDFDVVASTSDRTSCLEAIRNLAPDVALIADSLPDLTVSDVLAIAKAEKLSTRLVFFTEADGKHDLTAAIAAGACSAISKYAAPGTMLQSLRLMAKSGVSLEPSDLSPAGKEADGEGKIEKMLELLTPRERQIVRLVSEGMSNKEIARRLDVSHGTIKVHLHNIFQKLEITNRTVLATISWLQRTSGFSALVLAFLAFAIADELKASEANDNFAHDDGPGQADEHAGYEVLKKAILQHLIVSKSGGTPALTERDLLTKASQAENPAAAMVALRAAEQFLGSKSWKEGGSGAGNLPAQLLPAISEMGIGSGAAPAHQIPLPAFTTTSVPSGYGTFAALAGALIYALSDPHVAAHASEVSEASIESFLAGTKESATTALAAITHGGANHADSAVPDVTARDLNPHSASVTTADNVAQEGTRGEAGPVAAGHNLQTPIVLLDAGHAPASGGDSPDQMKESPVGDAAHHAPSGAKSVSSDSVADLASGPGRLNLAAFGALAWLHLTAPPKSIPPHTLAWVYDPASNQTIVFVNSTDRVLDVGDRGLVEVHLQGIVSVAETDSVQPAEGAVHAATLEQLEQALMPAATTDETAPNTNGSHAHEDSFGTAGVWSASADDGLSFKFAAARAIPGNSAKSSVSTSDEADTTEEISGSSGVPAYGSSIGPGQSATTPAADNHASKGEPGNPNAAAPSTNQNAMVPPGFAIADGSGRGNSEHNQEPGSAKAETAQADSEPGNSAGHGNKHDSQTADGPPQAAKTTGPDVEHGHSGHSASDDVAEAGKSGKGAVDTEHGHSQHEAPGFAKAAATEMAEAKSKPGNDVGNDHEHHSQAPDSPPKPAKTAEPGGAEHGHSGHSVSDEGAEAGKSGKAAVETEHGHSQDEAPGPAKAGATETAEAKSKPGNGVGNDHEHHSPASDSPAKTAETGGAEHGHSGHTASAKAAEAGESGSGPGDTEHGHSPHGAAPEPAKAAMTEMAEAKPKAGNGIGNDNGHHSQASDDLPAAAKTEEPGGEHGNSAHSASATAADASESVATDTADHGNPQRTAHAGSNASEDALPAKAAFELGREDHVFRFDGEAAPSTPITVVEPKEFAKPLAALSQEDGLQTVVDIVSHAPDDHTVQHGNHGPHPGSLPGQHDLLI